MGVGQWKRLALAGVLAGVAAVSTVVPAVADDKRDLPAYDISWPQCPDTLPQGEFAFAVIGLNNGRPFTSNRCFSLQYKWASTVEAHPDVYINLDFPRAGRAEAATGPYGRCAEEDDWCRGYNYGWALAKDSVQRARALGVSPARYWFDVEMDNYWSDSPRNNSQVIRGALDYFLDFNLPVGIYGTRYQWGLITGGFQARGTLPLWVAGATSRQGAYARCGDADYEFAGGETWMVQYLIGQFDENVLCDVAPERVPPAEVSAGPASTPEAVTAEAASPEWRASNLPVLRPEKWSIWQALTGLRQAPGR